MKASTQSCSSWSLVHSDLQYAGYSVMAVASVIPLVALGNLSGDIKLINLASYSISELHITNRNCSDTIITGECTAHKGKVFSICMLVGDHEECQDLVSCGPDGEMVTSWIDLECLTFCIFA